MNINSQKYIKQATATGPCLKRWSLLFSYFSASLLWVVPWYLQNGNRNNVVPPKWQFYNGESTNHRSFHNGVHHLWTNSREFSGGFLALGPLQGFCGALSAFSGTIGDIADVQFGCATEDSMLDVPSEKKSSKGTQHLGK